MKKRELKRARKLAVLLSAVLLMEQPAIMNPAIVAHAQEETTEVAAEVSAEVSADEATEEDVAEASEEGVEEAAEESVEESAEDAKESEAEAEESAEDAESSKEATDETDEETADEAVDETADEAETKDETSDEEETEADDETLDEVEMTDETVDEIEDEISTEITEVVAEEVVELPTILNVDVDPTSPDVTKRFADVPAGQWYVNAVQFVYDRAIMNGVSNISFAPGLVLTREQFITVLYNLEGNPEVTYKPIFTDVADETSWYAKSVTWASENNITSGVGDNKFGTGKEISREQLATLIYNYAQQKGVYNMTISEELIAGFPDADKISDWATQGMKWAVTNKVMNGKAGKGGVNYLDPQGKASRAECAQMIKNFIDASYQDASAVLKVEGFEEIDKLVVTDEKISFKGTLEATGEIREFSCTMTSVADTTVRKLTINGEEEWSIDEIPLDIGTNYFTFIVRNAKGEAYRREIMIIRDSVKLKAKDNVVSFNVQDEKQLADVARIYDQILDTWKDDKGTADTNDDEVCIAVNETNPLYGYIKSNKIKSGDVVFIPENDYFITGFTMIYKSHDDKAASDVKGYDASKYEVIHMAEASIMDLIDGDISINLNEISKEDPVAFVYNPYSEYAEDATEMLGAVLDPSVFDFGNNSSVKQKGLQLQNLAKINPTIDMSNLLEIKMGYTDIVLFDKDGDPDTTNDRLVLDGTTKISDIQPTVGVEWHPVKTGNPLPNQMLATLEYTETNSVKVTAGHDFMPSDLFSDNFDNKRKDLCFGAVDSVQGVNTQSTFFIGAVGLHAGGKNVELGDIADISDKSYAMTFNPVLVVALIIDLNGDVKAEMSVELKETAYIKKGVNIQQDGFKGNYGTVDQNKGTANSTVYVGKYLYHINTYNVRQKSKTENVDPEKEFIFTMKGNAEMYAGFGVGVGVMVYGIMPVLVKGTIGPDLTMSGEFMATISNYPHTNSIEVLGKYLEIVGNLAMSVKVIARLNLDVNLKAETDVGDMTLKYSLDPPLDYKLWELYDISTIPVNGYVYKQDYDGDDVNDKPLAGAKVTFKEKGTTNPKEFTATTDANGFFEIGGILETMAGKYTMTVSKNGYEDYEEPNFKVESSNHNDPMKIYLEGTKGKIKINVVDKNGKPVSGADVKITNMGQTHTDGWGIVKWEAFDPDTVLICEQTDVNGVVEVDAPCRNPATGFDGCFMIFADKGNKMGNFTKIGYMEWPRCIYKDQLEEGKTKELTLTLIPYSESTEKKTLRIQTFDSQTNSVIYKQKVSVYKGWNLSSKLEKPDYEFSFNEEIPKMDLAKGRYTISVKCDGYKARRMEVLVSENMADYVVKVYKQ